MKFFQWVKWIFSSQEKHTFTGCVFYDVVGDFKPIENGTTYQYNIQYTFIDCVIKQLDPIPVIDNKPLNVNVEIRLPSYNCVDVFILPIDKNYDPIIIEPSDISFTIGYSLEPVLSKQEKEDLRTERFVDAMIKWNDRVKFNA